MKKPHKHSACRVSSVKVLLPDLDSNQDKQNQNLSYYHYTIGQPRQQFRVGGAKIRDDAFSPK